MTTVKQVKVKAIDQVKPELKRTTRAAVTARMRRRILDGLYRPGDSLPVNTELADEFGASHVTVLRAVDQLRSEGFLHAKRGTGTFVTDTPPHLYECALVLPEKSTLAEHERSRFLDVLAREAQAWNQHSDRWRMRVWRNLEANRGSDDYRHLVEQVENGGLAGLLFPFCTKPFEGTPLLDHPGIARAAVSSDLLPAGISSVVFDHDAYLHRALRAVAEQGCKRVAVLLPVALMHWKSIPDTHRDISAAVVEHGLRTEPHWIIQLGPREHDAVRRIVQLLLNQPAANRPDAIVLFDDHMTEPATLGALEAGGNNISIVAYCNFPDRPKALTPVTRLGFDCHELFGKLVNAIDQEKQTGKITHQIINPMFEAEWLRKI